MTVRVALGTAIRLGLRNGKSPTPYTAHLLTPGKCTFDCAYCTKAKSSTSRPDFMCRVTWPAFPERRVWEALEEHPTSFERVCIQVVNRKGSFCTARNWIREIRNRCSAPISVETRVDSTNKVRELLQAGADCVGLPLDVASEELYPILRGGGMDEALRIVTDSADMFPCRVSTHIIVGLGETDKEVINVSRRMRDRGIPVGLFAFTPCPGTRLESMSPPSVGRFRRIQLATYLVGKDRDFVFAYEPDERVVLPKFRDSDLSGIIERALLTRGCSGCNRPMYNEHPGCTPFNYPGQLSGAEIEEAMRVMER